MDVSALAQHGVLLLLGVEGLKTFRAVIRGRTRKAQDAELLSEMRETKVEATEANERAASANRKLFELRAHLEDKGLVTPDPTRPPVRSKLDPVTVHGFLPGKKLPPELEEKERRARGIDAIPAKRKP